MSAAAPLGRVLELAGPGFGARLADARTAVAGLAADAAGLADLPDDDVLAVMRELTSMAAQIDGLRVATAAVVRDRDLMRRQGARSLTGWLRADPRTADDAWRISQLATASDKLPKILTLLQAGQIGLAQAGAAVWQVSQLPEIPVRPDEAPDPATAGELASDSADAPGADPDEAWAGLWGAGDVHAAADELFSRFLPSLDASQIRVMGAHLREAADAQERATADYDDYARRRLRISRTLGNTAEITGRLHAEAAEQVIATFDRLGVKHGPDDTRTKAQRWADVLTGLAGLTLPGQPAGSADDQPGPGGSNDQPGPGGSNDQPGPGGSNDRPGPGGSNDRPGPGGHEHGAPGSGSGSGEHYSVIPPGFQRPRVIVTVPLAALLGRPLASGGILGSGTPLSGQAARRLACDAEIVRIITGSPLVRPDDQGISDGWITQDPEATGWLTALLAEAIAGLPPPLGGPSAILDAGRKHPGWTARQRDALHAQYGGHCGYPRCTGPIDVIHHVIHWTNGGPTAVWNGLPLCDYHHWLVHEGGWRVRKHPNGSVMVCPPPPGWRPGTIYRHGKPIRAG